jgi:hypothetical protein
VNTTDQYNPNLGMLVEAWVRIDLSQSSSPTILGNASVLFQQFNGRIYGKVGSAGSVGNVNVGVGDVHHVLFAYSGATAWQLYIDGSLAASGTTTAYSTVPNYTTMGGHWNGTLAFNGAVSRAAFYTGVYADAAALAASHYDAGMNGIASDTTAPVIDIVGVTAQKISRKAGKDASNFTVTADETVVEYEIRAVPSNTSPHTAGTLIESGTVNSISFDVTITDDELVDAQGGVINQVNHIKAFGRDAAGNWSE